MSAVTAENIASEVRALLARVPGAAYWQCGIVFLHHFENRTIRVVEIITTKERPTIEGMISRHQMTMGGLPVHANPWMEDDELTHAALFDAKNTIVGFLTLEIASIKTLKPESD